MFDAEQRVVIANERYAEIYGLTPEQVKPGTTLRQILEQRIAKGVYADADPEALHQGARCQRSTRPREVHAAERRALHLRRAQPMRERRLGHARTRTSPSASKLSRARLEQQNAAARRGHEQHVQGLAMFDDRAAARHLQQALCRDVRPDAGAGAARHDRCARSSSTGSPAAATRRHDAATSSLERCSLARPARSTREVHELRTAASSPYRYSAMAERRQRHHASGHHRAAPLRGQDRAHGAARRADRPAQPRAAQRAARAGAGPRQARRDGGGPPARSRPLQDRQRHARPSRRRQAPEDGDASACAALVRETDTIARMGGDEFAVLQVGDRPAGRRHRAGAAHHRGGRARPTTSTASRW